VVDPLGIEPRSTVPETVVLSVELWVRLEKQAKSASLHPSSQAISFPTSSHRQQINRQQPIATLKIVIKFGSGILTKNEGTALDPAQFTKLVDGVAQLKEAGHQPIVVSSGAVGAGLMTFEMHDRPTDTAQLQACAAVGQTRLMHLYETRFREYDLNVAQLLLTNEDFKHESRRQNVANTLSALLGLDSVIPIINENDSVAVEELKVGDNDVLSAHVATLTHADRLILLTSVDGLIKPGTNNEIVHQVDAIDDVLHFASGEIGKHSTGGMASKLQAVKLAVGAGVETLIANGRNPGQLLDLVNGAGKATRFLPANT
jgi:glutamate 5-kinase